MTEVLEDPSLISYHQPHLTALVGLLFDPPFVD